MAYQNPFTSEKHVHRELVELTTLLQIDAQAEAETRLQEVADEANAAWFADPVAIELGKLQDTKDQHDRRRGEVKALVETQELKSRDATRTGSYADLREADSRLKELNAELEFSSKFGLTLSNDYDKLLRKATRAHEDVHRKSATKVRQQCELEHVAKMSQLLEMIRGQPDMMELIKEIAVNDVVYVQSLP